MFRAELRTPWVYFSREPARAQWQGLTIDASAGIVVPLGLSLAAAGISPVSKYAVAGCGKTSSMRSSMTSSTTHHNDPKGTCAHG